MSDIIRLLPDSVANQIAAGEVIQRPASVIKELVENAIDAGAQHVDVLVVDAGKTSIQVIDDGKGMSETDARLSFERHATSKIREAADLFALHTMGFRGEALASIAAVAQVELRTRMEGEELGTMLTISGSKVEGQEAVSCPKGSSFSVKNLFFNVPARRKFLKSNQTELSNILTEFERIVLVNPEVSFTLHHNGAERGHGEYLIILGSDCILPEGYLAAVESELQRQKADAFGGPDRAHDSFTNIQKAINYAMTSFFTTGGIRGGKKKMDKFYPRSFNMGVRAEVYKALGGFSKMRFGEDIDFSIRIFQGGYACRLFPEAWVWHKRRTDLKKFFKQVHNSGIARINLYKKYPESLKVVHLLPALFTIGIVFLLLCSLVCSWSLSLLLLFALIICVDSTLRNKSFKIGLLSILASFIQLIGYGTGFLRAWWKRCVLGKNEFAAFEKNFYK